MPPCSTPAPPGLLVATCDAQVEGIHFLRHLATYEEIGHKALAVNLSDIAAMGAEPRWALISLIVPDAVRSRRPGSPLCRYSRAGQPVPGGGSGW